MPHFRISAMHAKRRPDEEKVNRAVDGNGSFCLGWLELQGPENMEWMMHAKQRNPSRIQAQEVAQKGPECDAKVCLTRPSNPLKTLGPEPRLVCFIQTIIPHPRQRVQNGETTPRCAS